MKSIPVNLEYVLDHIVLDANAKQRCRVSGPVFAAQKLIPASVECDKGLRGARGVIYWLAVFQSKRSGEEYTVQYYICRVQQCVIGPL
jgi:hypothetical protein